jgi:hypothetical protein
MTPDETDLIVKHSLSNEKNLEVAIKVALTFRTLRQRVFASFLEQLDSEIRKELDASWTSEIEFAKWPAVFFRKQRWPREKSIGVGSDKESGKNIYFWVTRFGESINNVVSDGDLKRELDGKIGQGDCNDRYCWSMYSARLRHWDSEEALLDLYTRKSIVYWKTQLLRIGEVVNDRIDETLEFR